MLRSGPAAAGPRLEARRTSMQPMPPYKEQFPVGSKVRIADVRLLEEFQRTWQYHHKLDPNQLAYAGQIAEVENIGFCHGGDVLYELHGIPGIWHEQCLGPVPGISP